MTRHQYGISALVSQTSFRGKTIGGVAKCRLFPQAIKHQATIVFFRILLGLKTFVPYWDPGKFQGSNKIGFWCDWENGDGSVMMIGGGGKGCNRADHGIGITETGRASFVDAGYSETEYDFGYDAATGTPLHPSPTH